MKVNFYADDIEIRRKTKLHLKILPSSNSSVDMLVSRRAGGQLSDGMPYGSIELKRNT